MGHRSVIIFESPMSQNIMPTCPMLLVLCVHHKTAPLSRGMDPTWPLQVSCGIWHQDVGSNLLV